MASPIIYYFSTNNKLIFEDDPLYSVRLCCHFYFI